MATVEQREKLNAKLPASAVAERSQAGQTLSYLQGHYVIRKLNEIFGNGEWSYEVVTRLIVNERTEDEQKVNGKVTGKVWRWHVSYASSCRLRVNGCEIVDVGHGHGIDKDCGLAHESAEKEAATDSLKRCAKSLGDALGLALYSKDQEHVVDDSSAAKATAIIGTLDRATSNEAVDAALNGYQNVRRDLTTEDSLRIIAAGKAARARINTHNSKTA